jgi:hypothetical protein
MVAARFQELAMYPVLPADAMAGALQWVACFFTVAAAVASCLLRLR